MDRIRRKKKRMDRLSGLPNEIICHIVSFVSAKEAAFVSVLSKRFENVFTIIPNLQFCDRFGSQRSLTDFLDGVLALPASSRIRKFSIGCYRAVDPAHYAHVNRCLCDVLKRGVLDLELGADFSKRLKLPFEVYTCKTLVRLRLGSEIVVNVLPENACLPALEILIIDSVWFKDLRGCLFQRFLSACSVLKELIVHEMDWGLWNWSGNVSSPTLERLTISHGEVDQIDFTRITLDTPSLTYLDLSDVVPIEYQTVNLDSLVEAKLHLMLTVNHRYNAFVSDHDTISSNPTNLIKGLKNVEIMELASYDTFQAFYYFREAIPVFNNLHHLTITPCDEWSCQKFLPFFLKKSPNLKTLVIRGALHYDAQQPESVCKCMPGYSFLLSCPVKVLEITRYNGTAGEVEQLKQFLENLSCLKSVYLHSPARPYEAKKTLELPRVSSKCKIQVQYY